MARSTVGWLLAAFAAVMLFLAWGEVFAPVNHFSYGLAVVPAGNEASVASVVPGSSAARLGIRPGDTVLLSALSLSDRYRVQIGNAPAGSTLAVPLLHAGRRRAVVLRSGPANTPAVTSPPALLVGATITLLIVGLIALRRPSLATAALVFYGAGSVTTFAVTTQFAWVPDPWFGAVSVFINGAFATLPALMLLVFVVRFPRPPESDAGIIRRRAGDAIVILGAILCVLQAVYEPLFASTWTVVGTWATVIILAVVLLFAGLAYRDASGESRKRIAWVLVGLAVSSVAYATYNAIQTIVAGHNPPAVIIALTEMFQTALPVALAYAVLRHRVLDIGFVLNRTMVFAVMTTLVVIVVGFVDWLTGLFLSEQRWALAIEAVVTIAFGLALNWIHVRTAKVIDRVVFRARHIAEKRIEYRISALGFASSVEAVDAALAMDAPQILDLASAAVFTRLSAAEPFRCKASSGWALGSADAIDADSTVVRTLRAVERPIFLDDLAISHSGFPGGDAHPLVAIPIVAQHELIGFALYGSRRDGTLPDPEEISLLARLAESAGNAYGAVEAHQWRERAAALERSLRAIVPAG